MSALLISALGLVALIALGFVVAGRAGTGVGAGFEAATWPLFGLLTAIALSALLLPDAYRPVADGVLRISGVHDRLRSVDEAIESTLRLDELAAMGARSRDMLGRVRDLFGGETEDGADSTDGGEQDGSATDADPGIGADAETEPEVGLVEAAVRPLLVDTMALVIRALALAGSLAGMLALVALRTAAKATRAAGGSRTRVDALEARVASLEERLQRASGDPPSG